MPDEAMTTERQPAQVPPAETPGLSGLLTLAVGVVVVAGLYLGQAVLIPITLAVLLSFLLAPLVNLLRRIRLGRVPSALIAVLVALGVILAIGGLIGTQIAALAPDIPTYAARIQGKIDSLQNVALSRAERAAAAAWPGDDPQTRTPARRDAAGPGADAGRLSASPTRRRWKSPRRSSRRLSIRWRPWRSC